jgi:hypothetical protein
MNTAKPKSNGDNEEEKKQGFFNAIKDFLCAVWQDIKKQARTSKFWIEVAAVGGGLFYAGITFFMWRDSHRNFMIDERCWLSIDGILPNQVKEKDPFEGSILIKNTGKTYAKQILSEWDLVILQGAESVDFDYSRNHWHELIPSMSPNGLGTIFPVIKPIGMDSKAPVLFTAGQAGDLIGGRAYLVMYGRGSYQDIFGESHWFHYCGWKPYYAGDATYRSANCEAYNVTGDGNLPDKQ